MKVGNNVRSERQDRLLWLLLLGVGVFNVLDYFLTLYALSRGMREGNPVMDLIVDTVYFPKVKLVLVPLLLILLWLNRRRVGERLFIYIWIIFGAYFLLMIYYSWLFWSIF